MAAYDLFHDCHFQHKASLVVNEVLCCNHTSAGLHDMLHDWMLQLFLQSQIGSCDHHLSCNDRLGSANHLDNVGSNAKVNCEVADTGGSAAKEGANAVQHQVMRTMLERLGILSV